MAESTRDTIDSPELEMVPEPDEESVQKDDRSNLLKLLSKAVGLDITTIAIPVTYNEPLSFIQRMAEYLQYWELVEKANETKDQDARLMWITVFAISLLSSSERTAKPFNPLLGETFEFYDPTHDYRFVSEQVSHHPPVGASYAASPSGSFWQTQGVKTKFSAPNALEVKPYGPYHLKLKESGDVYTWENLTTMVHNLILGKMWIDHYGDLDITCIGKKRRSRVIFKECGWFGRGWHEVEGTVYNDEDKPVFSIHGKWNESIYVTKLSQTVSKKKSPKPKKKPSVKEKKKVGSPKEEKDKTKNMILEEGKATRVWNNYYAKTIDETTRHGQKWKLTQYSLKLIELTDEIKAVSLATDSRLRTDRLALEAGDPKKAAAEKYKLEQEQRNRRRAKDTHSLWKPKFFQKYVNENNFEEWILVDGYWKDREERMKDHENKSKKFNE